MIDFQRYILIAAIAALSFMLLTEWSQFQQKKQAEALDQAPAMSEVSPRVSEYVPNNETRPDQSAELPGAADIPQMVAPETSPEPAAVATSDLIEVRTDVLNVMIDPRGGDVVGVSLPQHYAANDRPDLPFVLLENNQRRQYIAQSGLIGPSGTDTSAGRPLFSANEQYFELREGQEKLTVDLFYRQDSGAEVVKRFTFTRGEYLIDLSYRVLNSTDATWQGALFAQLKRDNSKDPSVESIGMPGVAPFLGVAYSTPDDPYEKIAFKKMKDKPVDFTRQGGWVAIVQHYFLSAWVPDVEQQNRFSTVVTRQGSNIARVTGPALTLNPGESGTISASLYAGPKDQYRLEEISPGLELSVDYSWLWWIAQPLFWLLTWLHGFTNNWGWAIIGVTVMVKILFFQLNATAFKSMANMRRVQPKLLEIRERYKDDRQKQSQAMMELYKKEKVNPMSGCLPMLVQMPVFIALYWVLMESVELRHAPWILWIKDLSAMDPYFILPLIMGASMFIQQKLNPPPPDPMQAKIMQWLPVVFTFFFLFFPAGLVLYWVVNNTLSIVQQYVITKAIAKDT